MWNITKKNQYLYWLIKLLWFIRHSFICLLQSFRALPLAVINGLDSSSGKRSLLAVVPAVWAFQTPVYLFPQQVKAYRLLWSMALEKADSPNITSPNSSAHSINSGFFQMEQKTKAEVHLIWLAIPVSVQAWHFLYLLWVFSLGCQWSNFYSCLFYKYYIILFSLSGPF